MAAPEYVPVRPMDDPRVYESPPRRPDPWKADRPGDLKGGQPYGERFGVPGPDQGYALKVAHDVFRPLLRPGRLGVDDVIAGCLGIALRRAALFGRAPVAHDLRLAFSLWGFLDDEALVDPALVALRERLFAEVGHHHHYAEARAVVDAVPESTLRLAHTDVRAADWRTLLDV